MHSWGLIVAKKGMGTGGARIYQRTKRGRELHLKWSERQQKKEAGA